MANSKENTVGIVKTQMSGFGGMVTFALKGGLPAVEELGFVKNLLRCGGITFCIE